MLRLTSITLSGLSTAWLLYWLPRSEWKYRPRSGFRNIRAFLSAVTTNSASKVSQELPSYHFSAEEVQDHSKVQPSFHRRNVSNIADPDLVDSTGLQILYQIGHSAISRHCRARSEGLLATRRQFIFTHQPRYSILSALDPILAKRLAHPGTAVTPFIGCKDSPYLLHQFGLLSIPQSRFGFLPLIIPTAANPKGLATFLGRIFHPSTPQPRIPGFGSSPSMSLAFFKITR